MILTQLLGGLGNQMFQYATARALAAGMGTELALDTSRFGSYRLHQGFELHKVFAGARQTEDLQQLLRFSALWAWLVFQVFKTF